MVPSLLLLSLALATDATAVAAAMGACGGRVGRAALLFGVFQGGMAALGAVLGTAAADWIGPWDHVVAFVLLGGLGSRAVLGAWNEDAGAPPRGLDTWPELLGAAVATSVDALAAGVTLPALGLGTGPPALVIGLVTWLACLAGGGVGERLGHRFGRPMQVVGGAVLVAIGVQVFASHVAAGG